MTKKHFAKEAVIFREGEIGDSFFQIENGKVGIYLLYGEGDEKLLTTLEAGKFFGEMAVIETYPRSATAVALADTDVTEIACGEVRDFFSADSDKIIDIMKSLGDRLRALTDDYDEVSDTIKKLSDSEGNAESAGLIDKIKKFANVYKRTKSADKISAEELRKLSQKGHSEGYNSKVETYKKGTVIFKEGETGDCMYDVHFGSVAIYKDYGTSDEKLLTKLSPNEFFGELGLIENVKRSATAVVAADDTIVEVITASDLKNLFEQNPPKVEMILEHLSFRLRKLTKEYMSACQMMYRVSEAGYKGNELGEDVKSDIKSYVKRLYD